MRQLVESQVKTRRMYQLWLLVLIFALPIALAWFFYLNPELLPKGRTNKGELIGTPLSVADISLKTFQGDTLELATLQPKWTLVLIGDERCSNRCQQRVFEMRQISKALADNSSRLERLLIMFKLGDTESLQKITDNFPKTYVAWASNDLLDRFSSTISKEKKLINTAWIIDPRGDLMMHYKTDDPAEYILSDLEKLMKASKNWVKGAQYGHQ